MSKTQFKVLLKMTLMTSLIMVWLNIKIFYIKYIENLIQITITQSSFKLKNNCTKQIYKWCDLVLLFLQNDCHKKKCANFSFYLLLRNVTHRHIYFIRREKKRFKWYRKMLSILFSKHVCQHKVPQRYIHD